MGDHIVHLGIIIDGNRRYAKRNNLPYDEVYKLGAEKVYETIRFVFEKTDIKELSIYALSKDNLLRGRNEINSILEAQGSAFEEWAKDPFFSEKKIKVIFAGELKLLPVSFQKSCEKLEEATKGNDSLALNILVAYSGDREISMAVKNSINEITKSVKDIMKKKDKYDDNHIESVLNTTIKNAITRNLQIKTPVDFIIRSGSGNRLSGFLLWQSEYAEIYTIDKLWPEITMSDIKNAIDTFSKKDVKHGL